MGEENQNFGMGAIIFIISMGEYWMEDHFAFEQMGAYSVTSCSFAVSLTIFMLIFTFNATFNANI